MSEYASYIAMAAGVAAVVSAIASSLSASNSGRSASAAEKSAEASVNALHRAAVRDLVILCQEAITEEARTKSLAIDLRSEITYMFNTPGNFRGSAHLNEVASLDKDVEAAAAIAAEARRLADASEGLYAESTIFVSQAAARVMAARDELRVTRESMERHLNDVRSKNAVRRAEKA